MEKNEIEELVNGLAPRVERLKSLYEQYFMGIERIPPAILRKEVDRAFWRLRRERFNNTALRFRFQQVLQRYNVYKQYWQRIMRQIERGTYKRAIDRAARKFDKETLRSVAGKLGAEAADRHANAVPDDEAPTPPRGMPTSEVDQLANQAVATLLGEPAPATASNSAPASLRPPTPSRPTPQGERRPPAPARTAEDGSRAVYDKFVAARQAHGESESNLSYDRLRRSLDKQRARLQEKHGQDKRIDFEVVEHGGKPVIRPIVKNK